MDIDFNDNEIPNAPEWCEGMTYADANAVTQGGCASGAWMPAVTYADATATMALHGDDVLEYVEDHYGEIPAPPRVESWSGIAVFYLSAAVELFASQVVDGYDPDDPDDPEW